MQKNNKGFSLVELLTVIVIMAVAVTLVGGNIASIYKARAKKSAETVDALISQCKIDTLSGVDCKFVLSYSEEEECFYAELYKDTNDDGTEDFCYKSESLANSKLEVSAAGETLGSDNSLTVKFNASSGGISKLSTNSKSDLFNNAKAQVTLSSTSTHVITFYKNTGEHVLDA